MRRKNQRPVICTITSRPSSEMIESPPYTLLLLRPCLPSLTSFRTTPHLDIISKVLPAQLHIEIEDFLVVVDATHDSPLQPHRPTLIQPERCREREG